jgi:hypothetical protein
MEGANNMEDNKIKKDELREVTGGARENYDKPAVGSVKRPDRASFGCEPCEKEHDGAGDRCSGL